MRSPRHLRRRHGLSLMEVLVALAIFLLAFAGLGQLVMLSANQALDAEHQVRAADLCQSKMAEVIAGAVSLTSQPEVPFEEDPNWRWSLDCDRNSVPGLWKVTVQVRRQQSQGPPQCTLTQLVLDPQIHGNVQDILPDNGSGSSSSQSSRSSGGN
jgi:general secretion pathway protein I